MSMADDIRKLSVAVKALECKVQRLEKFLQGRTELSASKTYEFERLHNELREKYGPLVSKAEVARVLHRGDKAVSSMCEDGRLEVNADGFVKTKSLAKYLVL